MLRSYSEGRLAEGYLQKWRDRESRGHWGREAEFGHSYSESLRKGQFLPNVYLTSGTRMPH